MNPIKRLLARIVRSNRSVGRKVEPAKEGVSTASTKVARQARETARKAGSAGSQVYKAGEGFARGAADSVQGSVMGIVSHVKYTPARIQKLEYDIKMQGGYYRELTKSRNPLDVVVIGGESFFELLDAEYVPESLVSAFEAAYPGLASPTSLQDHLRGLDAGEVEGFVSGIKGKLFEQQYVEYLNDGNLPAGYVAGLAGSPTQPGWDIEVTGPNAEIAEVLQVKATDSVSYVLDALEKYPSIDVVTTSEVYSHLVMNGISDGLVDSGIANESLTSYVEGELGEASLDVDFFPPVVTLAFIAFTSYRLDSLTLYEKSRTLGDRAAKAYLASLVGQGVAALTNTWWLGPVAAMSSRYLADAGLRKQAMFDGLRKTYDTNRQIIDRLDAPRVS